MTNKIEKLYIHFNQQEHYLSVEDYEIVLKSTKDIFKNLTNDILEIEESAELVAYAPEKGCIIAILGLVIATSGVTVGAGAFLLQFIESETGKIIIKRLTGNESTYYIEKFADLLRDLITAIFITPQENLKKLIEELKEINQKILKLDKSLKASSDFYKMLDKNKNIKAIGFSKEEIFPITRQDFVCHMTEDIIRDKGVHAEYKTLTIVKPVMVRTSKGKWTLAETGSKDEQSYLMEDEKFNEKTLNGDFVKQNPEDDEIIALTEYKIETKNGNEVIKNRKIVEIYEFNKEKFDNRERPQDFKLNEPRKKNKTDESPGQMKVWDNFNWE